MEGILLAALGAGLAVGLPGVASAVGSGIAGASGAGAVAEKKETFVPAVILEALPQTAVILGFVIGIMILGKIGDLGEAITVFQGTKIFGAGLIMGLAGLTPLGQAPVAAAGIGSVARNPETMVQNVIFTALPDISVILGFVISFMMLGSV